MHLHRNDRDVSDTRIYAASRPSGLQALVYSLEIGTRADLAMVLPLPVPASAGEDAVRFVSLEDYRSFFDDLDGLFVCASTRTIRGYCPTSSDG